MNNIKIYVIGLAALFSAGNAVFANSTDFLFWMMKRNFFLGNKAPIQFLTSIQGVSFVRDKVAAIEDVHSI